jgi:hypothetical protein
MVKCNIDSAYAFEDSFNEKKIQNQTNVDVIFNIIS